MRMSRRFELDVPLAKVSRGGLAENCHRGAVCVVSAEDGRVVYAAGGVDEAVYLRSTAKPFQAVASLREGVAGAYGYEQRHLAQMAASHRGHADQLAVLEELAALTGIDEERLAAAPGYPLSRRARDVWVAQGGRPRRLCHNCAGKHLGILAWCKLRGWPLEGYIHPDHPAQREIVRQLAGWAGTDVLDLHIGRDGCGLPVAAAPLCAVALMYGRLACPSLYAGADERTVAAALDVGRAMNAYPQLVEGQGRLASLLLEDDNVVAKSGAQGMFAFGLRRERLGVAIAVSDGTDVVWPYVVIELLRRFGGVSEATMERLAAAFPPTFANDAGELAGGWSATLP